MRLTSLDVFRGLAIGSMILANNPGSWDHVYPILLHEKWHGCKPVDLIFPFFLFIVGVASAFSLSKYTEGAEITPQVYWRIARRSAILFAFGLLLNGFPYYDLAKIRIMGVLQRISLAYLGASMAILNLTRKQLAIFSIVLLLGYWGALTLIPVPDFGAGNLTDPDGNLGAYLDRLILTTPHLLKGGKFDPEGLFSTIPAIVTVIIGYFTGNWLKKQSISSRTSVNLVMFGLSFLVIGYVWGLLFPLNKALWTSSYVIYTAGWALLTLAGFYEAIEIRGWRKWFFPLEVMGVNAIFLFVASGFFARILLRTHIGSGDKAPTTYTWIYQNWFQPLFGDLNGSLAFAITTLLFWWIILYLMYRRNWLLKV